MEDIIKILGEYWPIIGPICGIILAIFRWRRVAEFFARTYNWFKSNISFLTRIEYEISLLGKNLQENKESGGSQREQIYKKMTEVEVKISTNCDKISQIEKNIKLTCEEMRKLQDETFERVAEWSNWRAKLVNKIENIENENRINGGNSLKDIVLDIRNLARLGEFRWKQAMNHSEVGLYECDSEGNRTWSNERLCEMVGMSDTEMIGKGWLKGVLETDRLTLNNCWRQSIENGVPYSATYMLVNQKLCSCTECHDSVVVLKDPAGKVIKYLGTVKLRGSFVSESLKV